MSDTLINENLITGRNKLHNAMWEVRDILAAADLWQTPDTSAAFSYAVQEIGEVFDARTRALRPDDNRNSDREVDFDKELADLWIMLATAYGRSPQREGSVADGVCTIPTLLVNLNHQIAVAYRHFSQGEDYHLYTGTALIMVEQLCDDLERLVVEKLLYIATREANKESLAYLKHFIYLSDIEADQESIDYVDTIASVRKIADGSAAIAIAKTREILEPFWRTDG